MGATRRPGGGDDDGGTAEFRFGGPLLAAWALVAVVAVALRSTIILRLSFLLVAALIVYLGVATCLLLKTNRTKSEEPTENEDNANPD